MADDDYPERDALRYSNGLFSAFCCVLNRLFSLYLHMLSVQCRSIHVIVSSTLQLHRRVNGTIKYTETASILLSVFTVVQDCGAECRRAYQKCPAELSRQGRAADAALINQNFDVDQISDNCRFR